MALDSVDYSEEKASKILEIVMQDDKANARAEHTHEVKEDGNVDNEAIPNEATDSGTDQMDRNDRYLLRLLFELLANFDRLQFKQNALFLVKLCMFEDHTSFSPIHMQTALFALFVFCCHCSS